MKVFGRILFLAVFYICCQQAGGQQHKIIYQESNLDFANPERGFYIPLDAYAHKLIPLNEEKLIKDRTEMQKHGSASYGVYSTLLYRGYILDTFTDKPLSDAFLKALENDLAIIRRAGVKMIIRFAYTNKTHSGDCPATEKICPPYGDAPKAVMLAHIARLKPVLQKNADVIAVLQEGFIGIWGENYFTDYFGDASDNGVGKIMDNNWKDRNELLKALLEALPKDRMVQVRTPQIKQKFVFGPQAATTSQALPEKEAYTFSDKSRIGFHNDCFLASIDDYGTFYDYGSSDSPKQEANEALRKYFEQDSRYGPVGGETCDDAFSPDNDCAPAGHAEQELAAMHYSFLNTAYNNKVNNDWDSLGCLADIKKKLGYRFVLVNADFPAAVKAGGTLTFTVHLVNRGYAAPFNPRPVKLILRNKESGKEYFFTCKADVRRWFSGHVNWKESIELPGSLAPGRYEMLLSLPDKYSSLSQRPEYSIRLANENVWEEKTGYNRLEQVISITHK
ncbi:MAG: hypothetical protein JWM28_2937 [Chitinophagaceae bacterium]|nr:hypothetical protein [Chitinophagaceae bacterium]